MNKTVKSIYKQALTNYKQHLWVYLLICVIIGAIINTFVRLDEFSMAQGNVLSYIFTGAILGNNDDIIVNLIKALVVYIIKPLIFLLPLLCVVTLSVKMEKVTIKSVLALIKANAIKMIGVMIMLYGIMEVVSFTRYFIGRIPGYSRTIFIIENIINFTQDILPYIIPIILTLIMAQIIDTNQEVKPGVKSTFVCISKNIKKLTVIVLHTLIIMIIINSIEGIWDGYYGTNLTIESVVGEFEVSYIYMIINVVKGLVYPILTYAYVNVLITCCDEQGLSQH